MIFLPLLKPQIIHPYHIYILTGELNGHGRTVAAPVDACWVIQNQIPQNQSNVSGNETQEEAREPRMIFLPLL